MLTFTCSCGKPLAAKEEHGGQETICPACGNRLWIPRNAAADVPMMVEVVSAPPPTDPDRPADAARRPRGADDWQDRAPPRQREYADVEDRRDRVPEQRETSRAAVAALVAGLLGLCPLLLLIPNLV